MAYGAFADVYDAFNEDADYLALHSALKKRLDAFNIRDGILIDLGCGTGDLTLLLAQDGCYLTKSSLSLYVAYLTSLRLRLLMVWQVMIRLVIMKIVFIICQM